MCPWGTHFGEREGLELGLGSKIYFLSLENVKLIFINLIINPNTFFVTNKFNTIQSDPTENPEGSGYITHTKTYAVCF